MQERDDVFLKDSAARRWLSADNSGPFVTARSASAQGPDASGVDALERGGDGDR